MVLLWILACVMLIAIIYIFMPELVFHTMHISSFWHGHRERRTIALTFDDGPDERYTPQVLQILKEHDVRATFFLVANRARQNSELVQRIIADGHEVASHSLRHRHAWSQDPMTTWRDMRQSKQTLESLTGQPIRFYRPPWGAFNLATRLACKTLGLTPVLWDVRAIDWVAGDYADEIVLRVTRPAQPGSVVLCHDAGGAPGAPLNTIAALPSVIKKLRALGFTFSTVGELAAERQDIQEKSGNPYADYPFVKRGFIYIWQMVDVVFNRMYHVLTLNAIFRVNKTTWHHGVRYAEDRSAKGAAEENASDVDATRDVAAAEGVARRRMPMLQDGMKAMDIHFQNTTLVKGANPDDNRGVLRLFRMTKDGFTDIARLLQHHPDYQDVKVAAAVTLMNRGIELLGFHVEELPDSAEKRRLQTYMRFLIGLYHKEGFRRLRQGRQSFDLKLVWMTREEIIERYGEGSAR